MYSGSQINEVYRNPVLSSFPGQNSYLTFLRKAIEPPETLVIIESIVDKSNGFAI
jgi:hypothetical protein